MRAKNNGAFVQQAQQALHQGFKRITQQIELDLWARSAEDKKIEDFMKQCKQIAERNKK